MYNMKLLLSDIKQRISGTPNTISSPYLLVLGSGASISSGIPSLLNLCKERCEECGLEVNNGDYITAFQRYLERLRNNPINLFNQFSASISGHNPSIGYYHLAQLIKCGIFKTIITTNYDSLLEKALTMLIPYDKIKVFVRGEVPDENIVSFLNLELPDTTTIIKIHGDLHSNILMIQDFETSNLSDSLAKALNRKAENGTIIVGSTLDDINVRRIVEGGSFKFFVNPQSPSRDAIHYMGEYEHIKITFDKFFIRLNRLIQAQMIESTLSTAKIKEIHKNILNSVGNGENYFSTKDINDAISNFMYKLNKVYGRNYPDSILFIHDPKAPGGKEVFRRMSKSLSDRKLLSKTMIIEVEEGHTRFHERHIKDFNLPSTTNTVLIIDAITFTGGTIRLAAMKCKEIAPHVIIDAGVLYVSTAMTSEDGKIVNEPSLIRKWIYEDVVNRPEVTFPWGITQSILPFSHTIPDTDYETVVQRRSWGSVEAYATHKNCSVRILTIEPWQKISFQRHVGRDEYFVSLDDNIGLDFCADILSEYKKEDSEVDLVNIKNLESIVLGKGDCVLIPKGVWHRTRAFHNRVRLLEIAYGIYDAENDIERLYDYYNRNKNFIH